jgi:hypothetical protein
MEVYTSIRAHGYTEPIQGIQKQTKNFHKNVGKPYYPAFHKNVGI